MTPDELADRLLDFAARIGKLADSLPETRLGRHVANQVIRSGTSPAPNYEEGRAAESRRDFVHKLSISLKELRETRYWLRLTARSGLIEKTKLVDLLDESDQLCRILGQSLATARNAPRPQRIEQQPTVPPPK
ncbi:MAG TPA: four helix bundle protein [Lacipirellulaceae bacterium]|nr:four helix bundle protein [Lacipirellulaceae bacterium]